MKKLLYKKEDYDTMALNTYAVYEGIPDFVLFFASEQDKKTWRDRTLALPFANGLKELNANPDTFYLLQGKIIKCMIIGSAGCS